MGSSANHVGGVRTVPDFLKHLFAKHGGEARLIGGPSPRGLLCARTFATQSSGHAASCGRPKRGSGWLIEKTTRSGSRGRTSRGSWMSMPAKRC